MIKKIKKSELVEKLGCYNNSVLDVSNFENEDWETIYYYEDIYDLVDNEISGCHGELPYWIAIDYEKTYSNICESKDIIELEWYGENDIIEINY